MRKKLPIIFLIFIFLGIFAWFFYLISHNNLLVLNPQGLIATQEKYFIVLAMGVMLSVAIPVVLLTFFIAWKYREGNKRAKYNPEGNGNFLIKSFWWGILICLMLFFWGVVWLGAHQLDPYKPIDSQVKPMTVQVVALRWKWLFIYPTQHIATVNFLEIPLGTPITFKMTSDNAPMNSFWIPQLSGQIYTMSTMETTLHMQADKVGDYQGGAAEINGSGFAGMRFITRVASQKDFDKWVSQVKKSNKPLNTSEYNILSKPSEDNPVMFYSLVDPNLYTTIIMKDMVPPTGKGMEK